MSDFGPDELSATLNVSRETIERLKIYAELLEKWQKSLNLSGPSALGDLWRRHFLDSAQLSLYLPKILPAPVIDLGAGGGFPGLVLAAMDVSPIHLFEADLKKAVFLREAARQMSITVTIHATRIEKTNFFPAAVITARALAALPRLLDYAKFFIADDTLCLFHKGRGWRDEVAAVSANWQMRVEALPSLAHSEGVILRLEQLRYAGLS